MPLAVIRTTNPEVATDLKRKCPFLRSDYDHFVSKTLDSTGKNNARHDLDARLLADIQELTNRRERMRAEITKSGKLPSRPDPDRPGEYLPIQDWEDEFNIPIQEKNAQRTRMEHEAKGTGQKYEQDLLDFADKARFLSWKQVPKPTVPKDIPITFQLQDKASVRDEKWSGVLGLEIAEKPLAELQDALTAFYNGLADDGKIDISDAKRGGTVDRDGKYVPRYHGAILIPLDRQHFPIEVHGEGTKENPKPVALTGIATVAYPDTFRMMIRADKKFGGQKILKTWLADAEADYLHVAEGDVVSSRDRPKLYAQARAEFVAACREFEAVARVAEAQGITVTRHPETPMEVLLWIERE